MQIAHENEPIDVEQRYRNFCVPSGLKNIGNTCWFNSLIQIMFFLPNF